MSFLDLRQSWRSTWRQRGTTTIAVLLLGIGIGAASSVYTVVDTLFWKPSPISDPSRLAVLWRFEAESAVPFIEVSFPDYLDWRRDSETFQDMACFGAANHYGVLHLEEPFGLVVADVSVSFFDVLGARAEIGRTFRPDEEDPTSDHVVVLSYGLWQRLFAGDRDVVGRSVRLDELHYEVIGVMPEAFGFPRDVEPPFILFLSKPRLFGRTNPSRGIAGSPTCFSSGDSHPMPRTRKRRRRWTP